MNKLFHTDKQISGLDISLTGIKIMSINPQKKTVSGYGSIDLDPSKVQESLDKGTNYLGDNIKSLVSSNLIGKLPSDHVILGLPTSRTFSRTLTLPADAKGNLKEAIEIEADQYIPIPIGLLYTDYAVIEQTKEFITVLMSAVPKTLADGCIEAIESTGLQVIMAEPGISAVARILERAEDGHLPTVIIDVGPAGTDIAVLDGSIRVTGGVNVGGNTFTLSIAKKLGVALESAHQMKVLNGLNAGSRQSKIQAALKPNLDRIVNETRKVIRYYNERITDDKKIEQILVVGDGSNMPGIGDFFTNELIMPARVANPWQQLNFGSLPQPARQFRTRYITVAGLASVNPSEVWK